MPVPKPRRGEKTRAFISRCIKELHKIDPDRPMNQVVAICYSQARKRRKVASAKGKLISTLAKKRK